MTVHKYVKCTKALDGDKFVTALSGGSVRCIDVFDAVSDVDLEDQLDAAQFIYRTCIDFNVIELAEYTLAYILARTMVVAPEAEQVYTLSRLLDSHGSYLERFMQPTAG